MHLRATSIDELLSQCTAKTQRLIASSRKRIMKVVPHAEERLRGGWGLIGYNAPAYFAFIAPDADFVRIGFEWGVMLTDVSGLLEGEGSQVRYVTIRSASELRASALTELLRQAATLVPPPRRRRG